MPAEAVVVVVVIIIVIAIVVVAVAVVAVVASSVVDFLRPRLNKDPSALIRRADALDVAATGLAGEAVAFEFGTEDDAVVAAVVGAAVATADAVVIIGDAWTTSDVGVVAIR